MTHLAMPALDDAALAFEVNEPLRRFEDLGLQPPRFLAYPYGESDQRVRRVAAPYLGAFTTRQGLVGVDADWTRLPRVEVLAGLTPRQLVWRLRRLTWEEGARRGAIAARRFGGKALRRLAR
jgi:hypothetical protein